MRRKENRNRGGVNAGETPEVENARRVHTGPTLERVEKQSEVVLDGGAAAAAGREVNDSAGAKAGEDQPSTSRGRTLTHAPTPSGSSQRSSPTPARLMAVFCVCVFVLPL